MKEYDHRVTFFNFKNGSFDRLSLENNVNRGCFRFQSDFEPSDLTGGFALKHPQGKRGRSKSKRRKSLTKYSIGQLGFRQFFALTTSKSFLILLLAFIFFCYVLDF
jgi:hypothetical protein